MESKNLRCMLLLYCQDMHITISKLIQPKYLLVFILVLSFIVRVYKISSAPASLSWDEVSIGYDAWSLLQDGRDQWGEKFPFIFRSFGEYKYPFHIYATAISVNLFGLSDYNVRLPSALLGVINILLLFFLAKRLTLNTYTALLASFFLAISPWHIQFSRINWETNFALFFFFVASILFLEAVKAKRRWNMLFIPAAYTLFGLAIYTYNAAKVFIPLYVLFLTLIFLKHLTKNRISLIFGSIIFSLFLSLNLLNPKLSGAVRFQQVNFPNEWIITTKTYQLTNNRILSRGELMISQYFSHFSPKFLFISGDQNPRHSSQFTGQIYLFDGLFIIVGIFFILKRRGKTDLVLLLWFFLALIPSSLVKEAPHASRAMFALGSWQIVSAIGLCCIFSRVKNRIIDKLFLLIIGVLIVLSFANYFYLYLNNYPVKYSQDWQYGYKQIYVNFRDEFSKYDQILISDEYAQPYIFALWYLKYDPDKFRAEVIRNSPDQWGFSTVKRFNNFIFSKAKQDDLPSGRSLIFASVNEKLANNPIKDVILNLDKSVAFYVYEYKK